MGPPTPNLPRALAMVFTAAVVILLPGATTHGTTETTIDTRSFDEPSSTVAVTDDTVPVEPESPPDAEPESPPEDELDPPADERAASSPRLSDSKIPVSSIVIAVVVLLGFAVVASVLSRRRPPIRYVPVATPTTPTSAPAVGVGPSTTIPVPDAARDAGVHADTIAFLLELGEALLDAGDAVGHVEAMLREVAAVYGLPDVRVVVLPSVLVISVGPAGAVTTEMRTGGGRSLRLDQIDDVLNVEQAAERGEITVADGRRELTRIRSAPPPFDRATVLAGYVVASTGLAMILRGGWQEVLIAAVLGFVIGALRIRTDRQSAAYQAFWPVVAAGVASATVFAATRVFDDLAVFPALVAPLIFFLPGALLTIGVLELATGHTVSGATRVAAGAMRLVLLSMGIVAGARLFGAPAGEIRGGTGAITELEPWLGVAVFGVGVAWFYGARRTTLMWILLVLYVSYSGQVIGGVFFGSALSAFFGAVAMTPVALFVARQPSGPAPLVTFLPGFWLLVPGALGLEGVARLFDDGELGLEVLVTTAASMVGISLGVLLGLILVRADPARPWSVRPDR